MRFRSPFSFSLYFNDETQQERLPCAADRHVAGRRAHLLRTGERRRGDLARDRADQRPERFAAGEKVDARVIQFDRKARKVQVSIKALEMAEEKEAISQYGSSDAGASLGDILGAALRARSDKK